jgi:hypothetical protein
VGFGIQPERGIRGIARPLLKVARVWVGDPQQQVQHQRVPG